MDPRSLTYRSPVWRYLEDAGAEFADINGYAVATSVGDIGAQKSAARKLAICDLSGLARMGVKGDGVGQWLSAQGLSVPTAPNHAAVQADGSLLAMLARNEGLVLGDIEQRSRIVEQLTNDFQDAADDADPQTGLVIPRQHSQSWFRISGRDTAIAMAKLCAVDLRRGFFDNLRVAQTSVARLSGIVIRDDIEDNPAIHLLADSASAGYLWECIMDAGAEYGISVIGLTPLQELHRS